MSSFSVIVAVDEKNGIGKNNQLPWKLKGDMSYFKEVTTKTYSPNNRNAVIMGKNTWYSIPEKFKPLENRLNIVLSSNLSFYKELPTDVVSCTTLDGALDYIVGLGESIDNIFVIGGQQLYIEALKHPDLYSIYLTRIHRAFECDTYFPELSDDMCLTYCRHQKEDDIEYTFEVYKKLGCCL